MTQHRLDARYLLCPLPVIRTQQMVDQLAPGDIVEVICTDPGALNDIPAWCRVHGHELLSTGSSGEDIVVTVKVVATTQ